MATHIIHKGAKLINCLPLDIRKKSTKAMSKKLKIMLRSDSGWDVGDDESLVMGSSFKN